MSHSDIWSMSASSGSTRSSTNSSRVGSVVPLVCILNTLSVKLNAMLVLQVCLLVPLHFFYYSCMDC